MSDNRLAEATEPKFARHETFAPRFGWLHKAHTEIMKDGDGGSDLFHRDDAPVVLGVGKNMVYSIRFWAQAFKLTREHPHSDPTNRAYIASPTWRAEWLLGERGADPYLEDSGSLWLLHWWLLSAEPGEHGVKCLVPSWYVMFHLEPFVRVSIDRMTSLITRHVDESFPKDVAPAPGSIARDAECLAKMYSMDLEAKAGSPGSFEDQLMSPFRELGLLEGQGRGKGREYRFTNRPRGNLPAAVLVYACLDYASSFTSGSSISLARLANEPGAPGRAFRMREPELIKAIESLVADRDDLQIIDSLGQRSLTFTGDPQDLAWDVLDQHYGNIRRQDAFPSPQQWKERFPGLGVGKNRKRGRDSGQFGTQELIEENA